MGTWTFHLDNGRTENIRANDLAHAKRIIARLFPKARITNHYRSV